MVIIHIYINIGMNDRQDIMYPQDLDGQTLGSLIINNAHKKVKFTLPKHHKDKHIEPSRRKIPLILNTRDDLDNYYASKKIKRLENRKIKLINGINKYVRL